MADKWWSRSVLRPIEPRGHKSDSCTPWFLDNGRKQKENGLKKDVYEEQI